MKHIIFALALAVFGFAGWGCATLGNPQVKVDPVVVNKTLHLVCLECSKPELSEETVKACEKLEPVCSAMAGICREVE